MITNALKGGGVLVRIAVIASVICLTIVGLSAADQVRASVRKDTQIPEGGLGPALQTLAKEYDFQVLYRTEVVGSLRTQGAVGEFTPEEALKRLLKGTGLTYRYLDSKTITVLPLSATPPTSNAASGSPASPSPAEDRNQKASFPWDKLLLAEAGQGQAAGSSSSSGPPATGGEQNAAGKSGVEKLSEVLVTATRRTERAEDVPISIDVVSADDIDQRQLVGGADYLRGMPGVNQTDIGYGGSAIIIRGLETTTSFVNFGGGSTVGTYFGETPTTNSEGDLGSSIDIKLVDVQRVEVLRGPQGTEFGSSSMGGTVRIIPAAPVLDSFAGRVEAGYSETANYGGDNYNFQGTVNIPIVEGRFAVRAVAYKYSDSGFYINTAGSDAAYQKSFVVPNGVQAFAIDQKDVGATTSYGARAAALFQATDNLRLSLNYLNQKTETDGYPMATSGTYSQDLLQIAPEYVRRGVTAGANDTNIEIIDPTLEYDFGWANLLATYSYLDGASDHGLPAAIFGGSFVAPISFSEDSPHIERSGEVRFVTKLNSTWNFLGGLYYDKQYDTYYSDWVWYGTPALNPYVPPNRDLFFYDDRRGLTEKSEYGEASWEFLPHFTLTGGLRHYQYDRSTYINESGPVLDNATVITDVSNQASGTTYRGNLSYKPDKDTLLYAGFSQGFRLGRPQAELPAAVCDKNGDGIIDGTNVPLSSTTSVSSDTVDSYEVGGKFALLDHRVSIETALFYMDWKNIPVQIIPPCGFAYTANAGAARSSGIELQANFQLTQAFLVSVGGSYTEAVLTSDVPAQGLKSGDELPGSPKTIANLSLQYGFNIASRPALVRADASYVGPFDMTIPETPTQKAGSYVKLDATARVTVSGGLNIDLFVHNLTNEDAFVARQSDGGVLTGYRLRPRTVGFQLGYGF